MSLHRLDRIVQMNAVLRLQALLGDGAKALPFLLSCFTAERHVSTANRFCQKGTPQTTWYSRFVRTGLPSPKWYLKHARLIRLRAVADDFALSMAQCGDYMQFGEPSQLRQHIQRLGMSVTEFRAQTTTEGLLNDFMRDGVAAHVDTLAWFDPASSLAVNGRVRDMARGRRVAA